MSFGLAFVDLKKWIINYHYIFSTRLIGIDFLLACFMKSHLYVVRVEGL